MGLYKRGQVWWMSFSYNGKQYRRPTETSDKRLAEKIYHKLMVQVVEEKWFEVDEGKVRTFNELAEKYEASEFKKLKSWRSAESYLKQLKEFFGPYTLVKITPALIDEFKVMRREKKIKPASINRQLNILRRMFSLAQKRWLWIKQAPPIEMEQKADRKRVRHLTFEEYHTLLECCDGWIKDIVVVAAWTGLRQGNILNLKRNKVNLSERTIMVDSDDTKNGENLIIPIADPALQVFKEAMKVSHIKSTYVFCRSNGSPYYKMEVHRVFKEALKKAKIEDFRFHDLRHCFASWNRQAGVDVDTLADLMGHKDTRMTRRYAHIGPVHLANAVGLLEKHYGQFITNLSQPGVQQASEGS